MTIHIATSGDLGSAIRRGLRVPVCTVPISDNWLLGPCSPTPEGYPEARCDYWGMQGRERAAFLRSFRELMNAIDSRQRLVIWMSRLGNDTIAFWAICAWRLRRWPESPDLGLVVLGGPSEAEDATGVGGGFIRVTPTAARRGLDQARSLSLTRVREMARCWRKLSGRTPILGGRGDLTARGREPLLALGAYQAGFFPRRRGSGLLLSRFDELLFSCLAEREGATPANVFVSDSAAGEELRTWSNLTGDMFLSLRLAQWARHNGGDAALTSEPGRPGREMTPRYTLTAVGHRLLKRGLAEIAEGAPLPVWGATAYDPRAPWVGVGDPAGRRRLQLAAAKD